MFHKAFSLLATAIWLLTSPAAGQVSNAFDIDDLEREFESLAYGNHRRHHHRHGFLRPHRAHARHRKRAVLITATPATTISGPPSGQTLLPGRHPAVAQKLEHMEGEIRNLAMRREAAASARSNLEKNVQQAIFHMNEGVGFKHELARVEAQMQAEEIKLKKLEDDRLRLDRTHSHLVASLHHVMEPKIQFAKGRLEQNQRVHRSLEAKTAAWKAKEDKFHQTSLEVLEQRKESQKRLEAAGEAIAKARTEEEAAKKQLDAAKRTVAFNVESYKYAQTRARAAASQEEHSKEIERTSEASVQRLEGILKMEQRRVDESMAIGKDRVDGKIRRLESHKDKYKNKLSHLSDKYHAWQMQQRDWAQRVAAMKEQSHKVAIDYADQQRAVLDKAQAKAAEDAMSGSDWAWDEWPGVRKEDDLDEVHLSAV